MNEALSFVRALVDAGGRSEDVEQITGAGRHSLVVAKTASIRESGEFVRSMSREDQAAFVKSLALYESTVRGLGSCTLLFRALEWVEDPDRSLFDWVLQSTSAMDYYAGGARTYEEIEERAQMRRERATRNLQKEAERAVLAARGRAHRATRNLPNAIRRGDTGAPYGRCWGQVGTLWLRPVKVSHLQCMQIASAIRSLPHCSVRMSLANRECLHASGRILQKG